ncbi:MAG: GCN5-related N-acetyltransferase [Xanthobacteraceae bacterium]|jgi:RimJ/RimL family protein N-acetyltransferase|nr:GCN5-related N-acetyltransferase [Xanthobacteraceae bacterium]
MSSIPHLEGSRVSLSPFCDNDTVALAHIPSFPEVSKNITVDASSWEKCMLAAQRRISWHNSSWSERGYGVWAIRAGAGHLIGWCGFAAPDIGDDPEILYGLHPSFWGRGYATEAALSALNWLFKSTPSQGASAVFFGAIAPRSLSLLGTLGFQRRGSMSMADFLPDHELALGVIRYELWRLEGGDRTDAHELSFQAAYKLGMLSTLHPASATMSSLNSTLEAARVNPLVSLNIVTDAFNRGRANPSLDWFYRPKQ